jgi:hypothetical protein
MNDIRAAAQAALEALEGFAYHGRAENWGDALMNLRAALASKPGETIDTLPERVDEPVAWMSEAREATTNRRRAEGWRQHGGEVTELFTRPQQRKPLSEDEILTAAGRLPGWLRHHEELDCDDLIDFARAVEAAHGIGEKK